MDTKMTDDLQDEIVTLCNELPGINIERNDNILILKSKEYEMKASVENWNESSIRSVGLFFPGYRGSRVDKLCDTIKSIRNLDPKHIKMIRDWLNAIPEHKLP